MGRDESSITKSTLSPEDLIKQLKSDMKSYNEILDGFSAWLKTRKVHKDTEVLTNMAKKISDDTNRLKLGIAGQDYRFHEETIEAGKKFSNFCAEIKKKFPNYTYEYQSSQNICTGVRIIEKRSFRKDINVAEIWVSIRIFDDRVSTDTYLNIKRDNKYNELKTDLIMNLVEKFGKNPVLVESDEVRFR
jgi:hypothetical protein